MDRDAYIKKLKAQLDEWNAQVGKLEARMREAGETSKAQYQRYLDDLREQQKEAETELERLRNASEGAWQDVLEGTQRAWREYRESLEKAWKRFQSKDE